MKNIIFILVLLFSLIYAEGYYWETVVSKKGIITYIHKSDSSKFHEFKGVGIDSVRLEDVATILYDIPAYTEWVPYLSKSEVLEQISQDSVLIYQKYEVPWPFNDRDCVVLATLKKDFKKGILTVHMSAVEKNDLTIPKGTTRIRKMNGTITLEYISRNETKGTYQEKIDFGGNFPAWISNHLAEEIPHMVLVNIGKACKTKQVTLSEEGKEVKDAIEKSIAEGYLK